MRAVSRLGPTAVRFVPFRCLWTYRAGGHDATLTPARDVRPAPAPSVRPTYLRPPTLLQENRLRGMAGGENFPLACSLAGDAIMRTSRARTRATCPGP
eukprot:6173908-Pleurochrysis_carterae.AAC.1